MSALARADLERLLQSRKFGATLPAVEDLKPREAREVAPTDLMEMDAQLGGGWPRGYVSEIVGPASSGGTWVACASLAAATRRGELAACIDPLDMFDPESAATAGFVWAYLLWVRGEGRYLKSDVRSPQPARSPQPPADRLKPGARSPKPVCLWDSIVERAIKALSLVLQAEGFGLVLLDLQGVPPHAVRRLPFTTWRRMQRLVEGRDTVCLVLHEEPLARSAGGITLALDSRAETGRAEWCGESARARRLMGLASQARIVRAEWQKTTLEGFKLKTSQGLKTKG